MAMKVKGVTVGQEPDEWTSNLQEPFAGVAGKVEIIDGDELARVAGDLGSGDWRCMTNVDPSQEF